MMPILLALAQTLLKGDALQRDPRLPALVGRLNAATIHDILQSHEALVADGWVHAFHDSSIPLMDLTFNSHGGLR